MAKCKWTQDQLREQALFEAAVREHFPWRSLSYRYMEEDSREYDSPHTTQMFDGWLLRAQLAPGVVVDETIGETISPSVGGVGDETISAPIVGVVAPGEGQN